MSTEQSYPGKGDSTTSTQQNGSTFEQTVNSTPKTANSANQSTDLRADKWLSIDLSLKACDCGTSQVTTLYWLLTDAIHESVSKLEKDSVQEEDRETLFEDLMRYMDTQNELFTSLNTQLNALIAQIDNYATNQRNSDSGGQVIENPVHTAEINGMNRQIETLENELGYFKKLVIAQADLIGKGALLQHVNQSGTGEGQSK